MSMPSLPEPNPKLTKEQALNMILTSIALEETALSHIINAESEKMQSVLKHCPNNTDAILAINNSVKETLEIVMQNQMLLKSKMEKVLEHLPKQNEDCCCKEHCYCDSFHHFTAIPGKYCYNQNILWEKECCCQQFEQIPLEFKGCLTVDFMAELCFFENLTKCPMMGLQIICDGRPLFCKTFYPCGSHCNSIITGTTSFYLPYDCGECSVSVNLYSPCITEVKRAEITFFK